MSEADMTYVGQELENFAIATNWKKYWSSMIKSYVGRRILEVGAGIGSSTRVLSSMVPAEEWLCLEPDPQNIAVLQEQVRSGRLPAYCEIRQGTLQALHPDEKFDTLLYIDVLEHIQDDVREITTAAQHAVVGAHVIILAPAFPYLYSEFDRAIGHYRRYTREMFVDSYAQSLRLASVGYLDSVGLIASLANRFILRSAMPSKSQLSFWDRYLVPASRAVDRVLQYRIGRSILAVYQKRP